MGREFRPQSPEEEKRFVDLFRPHVRRLASYLGECSEESISIAGGW